MSQHIEVLQAAGTSIVCRRDSDIDGIGCADGEMVLTITDFFEGCTVIVTGTRAELRRFAVRMADALRGDGVQAEH